MAITTVNRGLAERPKEQEIWGLAKEQNNSRGGGLVKQTINR